MKGSLEKTEGRMRNGPDFIIIGAMKCGTTTLAAQLAAQPRVFMTTPKEPNFFSDDDIHARGAAWYESLFAGAAPGDITGEASTHYAKLPTYPDCAARLHAALPHAKLIYLTRDPVERLISHYIHEWSMGAIDCGIEEAVAHHPELIAYGRYEAQLAPYEALFGAERILRLRLEDMQADPQALLERVAAFLDRPGAFAWRAELGRTNISAERIRKFPFYGLIVDHPAAAALRRALVPKSLRNRIRGRLQMRDRPQVSEQTRRWLERLFTEGR